MCLRKEILHQAISIHEYLSSQKQLYLRWHCRAQVKCLGKFGALSFCWSLFKWMFSGFGDSCGFDTFPSLGFTAYYWKWYFDFSQTCEPTIYLVYLTSFQWLESCIRCSACQHWLPAWRANTIYLCVK